MNSLADQFEKIVTVQLTSKREATSAHGGIGAEYRRTDLRFS
jgi:hypothetical protein